MFTVCYSLFMSFLDRVEAILLKDKDLDRVEAILLLAFRASLTIFAVLSILLTIGTFAYGLYLSNSKAPNIQFQPQINIEDFDNYYLIEDTQTSNQQQNKQTLNINRYSVVELEYLKTIQNNMRASFKSNVNISRFITVSNINEIGNYIENERDDYYSTYSFVQNKISREELFRSVSLQSRNIDKSYVLQRINNFEDKYSLLYSLLGYFTFETLNLHTEHMERVQDQLVENYADREFGTLLRNYSWIIGIGLFSFFMMYLMIFKIESNIRNIHGVLSKDK